MSGRRSHVRFAVIRSPEGVLRVMRDVVVQHTGNGQVIAISREPGVLGESVIIQFPADETSAGLQARIVESQPIVVNGTVRHRLRLEEISLASNGETDDAFQRGPARQ